MHNGSTYNFQNIGIELTFLLNSSSSTVHESAYDFKTKAIVPALEIMYCFFISHGVRGSFDTNCYCWHMNYMLICVICSYINPLHTEKLLLWSISIHSHESIFEACKAFICSLTIISSLSITLNRIWHKCQTLMIWLSAPLMHSPRSVWCVRDRLDCQHHERSFQFLVNFPPSNRQHGTGSDNIAWAWKTALG